MKITKLSIIIPVFNEENTISAILQKVSEVILVNGIEKEIIVVNDRSTDGTDQQIEQFLLSSPQSTIRYFKHAVNLGKGGALHTGIKESTGDYIIMQDADLELDPQEINNLLQPIVEGKADVVYGSRFLNGNPGNVFPFRTYYANKFLTKLSNLCSGLSLTDMETCYKLIDTEVINKINLREQRFGFEPEVTAKLAKVKGIRITEVPISYIVRTSEEGKKIGWKDGVRAMYCIILYNLFR